MRVATEAAARRSEKVVVTAEASMTWAVMTREATAEPEATTAEKADEVTAETGATASETAAAIEATAVGRKTVE